MVAVDLVAVPTLGIVGAALGSAAGICSRGRVHGPLLGDGGANGRASRRARHGRVLRMSRRPLRVHAIYSVLDEAPLFAASVRSIYEHVDGITVITTHDRDWQGRPCDADELVALVLSRELDPEHKIELAVVNETNEARSRNRAMDLAAPRRRSLRVHGSTRGTART